MIALDNWIEELSDAINARLKLHEPLSAHTYFRIGGPAEVFAEIESLEQLKKLISFCRSAEASPIPLMIIGRGTNLLVSDRGVRGVVAKLCGDLSEVEFLPSQEGNSEETETFLIAGAAVALPRLARLTAQRGLTGLEFAFGIPGSLGGALVMNAGAAGYSISDVVDAVEVITEGAGANSGVAEPQQCKLQKDELEFGYRRSNLSEYSCIAKARLRMRSTSSEKAMGLMKSILEKKKAEQPLSSASAGCVFKNPPGVSAGKIIDECGLKGERVGGAQVSFQHANFIVNVGGASADDVLHLVGRVRSVVRERTGINLELELKVIEYNG